MMFTNLDYILLFVFVLAAFIGFKRGFFISLGGIVSIAAALVIAYQGKGLLVQVLEQKFGLLTFLSGSLNQKIPALGAIQTVQNQMEGLASSGLADISKLEKVVERSPAEYLAYSILTLLAFILLFIVASIVLKLLFRLLNDLFDHGVLGVLNRIAGMLLETAKYAIIVAVLLLLINPLLTTTARMGFSGAEDAIVLIQTSTIVHGLNGMLQMIQVQLWPGA
ncbi:MAG: CvpA family protein [Bacillota bacterium]|nr:CvpA family protein [Bacillota bacterium]